MIPYGLLVIGLAVLALLVYRAVHIWRDAGRWGFSPFARIGWAVLGAVVPSLYWWGVRVDALPPEEEAALLAQERKDLELEGVDSARCPLCGAEIPQAWTVTEAGNVAVAPGPVECPECDFRLDSCRHCAHFLPGPPRDWSQSQWNRGDATFGRCEHYKRVQPVEQAYGPDMARRLANRGYDQIRAPMRIVDSLMRPDFCNAFRPDLKRIEASHVPWPGPRRAALLRLLQDESEIRPTGEARDAHWLL